MRLTTAQAKLENVLLESVSRDGVPIYKSRVPSALVSISSSSSVDSS